jgi:ABC-type nitrate/sulfonate/bicarbonate transport system substrate-binding protein
MEARKIDVTFMIPPLTLNMRNEGFRTLIDVGAEKIPYQGTGIATTKKFLEANEAVVEAFLKAISEAIKDIKSDPDGSKAVMAKYISLDPQKDAAALDEAYRSILLETLVDIPYPTMDGLQVIIDNTAQQNPDAAKLSPADLVDKSVLDKLVAAGFFKNLK